MAVKVGDRKRKRLGKQESRKLRRKPLSQGEDEEIASDDDLKESFLSDNATPAKKRHDAEAEDDEEFFLNPDERRVQLAKQYLERIGLGSKTDAEVAEALHQEADAVSQRVSYSFANKISPHTPEFYRGHKDGVTSVAVPTKDATKAFTGSKDCSVICWDVPTGAKTIFSGCRKDLDCGGHFAQCLDVAVTEDGKTLYSVGQDCCVRVWDVRASTNRCAVELYEHTQSITPEGGLPAVYTTAEDKSLKQWNMVMRSCQDTFYGHTAHPNCIDILAHERPITGGDDATVRLWKVTAGTHFLYEKHTAPVDAVVQLSGHLSVSGSQDGMIMLWSVGSRDPLAVLETPHDGHWGCLRYSDVFFSGSDDGYIRCWKVMYEKTGKKKKATIEELDTCKIPVTGVVTQLTTTGDGSTLVAAVSREHRRGRWKNLKNARNGLLVVPLGTSFADLRPTFNAR